MTFAIHLILYDLVLLDTSSSDPALAEDPSWKCIWGLQKGHSQLPDGPCHCQASAHLWMTPARASGCVPHQPEQGRLSHPPTPRPCLCPGLPRPGASARCLLYSSLGLIPPCPQITTSRMSQRKPPQLPLCPLPHPASQSGLGAFLGAPVATVWPPGVGPHLELQ